ncbi:MAG TPA: heme exporter protein CcmD [Microvirga sp.]|jgi:heme exporter protein D|nr:heme exporter protein CcmD [Microvirga sp.]
MGSYTFFVAGSYGVTALVVGALVLRAILDHRAQVRALAELESRGMRRRSAAPRPARAAEGAIS